MLKRVAVATVFANGAERAAARRAVRRARLRHQAPAARRASDALGGDQRRQRRTVLFVTHDVDEALTLADRILVIQSGQLIDDLASRPSGRARPTACSCPRWSGSSTSLLAHLGLERSAGATGGGSGIAADGICCHASSAATGSRSWSCSHGRVLADSVDDFHRRGRARASRWCRAGRCVFTATFLSLADYWQGGLGVPSVAEGAPRSYLAAVLAAAQPLVRHDRPALCRPPARRDRRTHPRPRRLLVALEHGGSSTCRSSSSAPCRCSRWCRCSSSGSAPISSARSLFVAYGVGVIFFAGTVNAVKQRAADLYRQCPDARRHAAPALPHRDPAGDLSRAALDHPAQPRRRLGGGLGRRISRRPVGPRLHHRLLRAVRLSRPHVLRRALFILYASISYWAISRLSARLLEWAPPSQRA